MSRGCAWLWVPLVLLSSTVAAATKGSGGESDFCLSVRGAPEDGAVSLRLALGPWAGPDGVTMPFSPLDPVMRPGAGAQPAPSAPASSQAGAASGILAPAIAFMKPVSPLNRLLLDGSADILAGRNRDAEKRLNDCVAQAASKSDSLTEAACTNNLGVLHAVRGEQKEAQAAFERALRLYEVPRAAPANMPAPPGLSMYAEVMPPAQRAAFEAQLRASQNEIMARQKEAMITQWKLQERRDTRLGIERTTLNLGNLEFVAGRMQEAETLLKRAFDQPGASAAGCNAASANDLARLYGRLGRRADADNYRRLAAAGKRADDFTLDLVDVGSVRLVVAGMAAAPNRPATDLPTNPNTAAPSSRYGYGEMSGLFDDATLARLAGEAAQPASGAAPSRSIDNWRRLALRAGAASRADLEFSAHAALLQLHAGLGAAQAATYHGKRAANLAQATRTTLDDRSPSRDARRAFLRDRRQVYVTLAQVLFDQQRLAEAEQVLQLLKEDEGQQFNDGGPGSAALGQLALNGSEQALQRGDEDAVRQLRAADDLRTKATSTMRFGAGAMALARPDQVDLGRLKLALQLPRLAEQLRREPLQVADDDRARGALADMQAFLLAPARVDAFVAHLIEDAPQFDPPVNAADQASLRDIRQRLPRIVAELAPLVRDVRPAPSLATIQVLKPGEARARREEDVKAAQYAFAEPLESMSRGLRDAGRVEARQLQREEEASLRAASTATRGDAPNADDTVKLLATQPTPTALLYYLPGTDRLDALLVGANGRRHVRIPLGRAELDAQIDALLKTLRSSTSDPRPAAQALYQRVFAPIEPAVAASGARVLALSLADRLRFVPFGALHDGKGWLVERYALALHPGGKLAGRLKAASPNWRAVAFGASTGNAEFAPLANVRGEVAAVVRQGDGSNGALPGEAWLDRAFTADRLRSALAGNAQVLHIASHFKFVAGDAAGSYLLLGDGGQLSLRDLAGPAYALRRTELVTLSACATGLSANNTYGQEVDGLAALLMGQGAPSVLASLWEVDDRSTATLMANLYKLRESRGLSRALALQQAQLVMIRAAAGNAAAPSATGATPANRGVSRVRLPGDPEPEPNDNGAADLGSSHPFYWAAFVLMGNWL